MQTNQESPTKSNVIRNQSNIFMTLKSLATGATGLGFSIFTLVSCTSIIIKINRGGTASHHHSFLAAASNLLLAGVAGYTLVWPMIRQRDVPSVESTLSCDTNLSTAGLSTAGQLTNQLTEDIALATFERAEPEATPLAAVNASTTTQLGVAHYLTRPLTFTSVSTLPSASTRLISAEVYTKAASDSPSLSETLKEKEGSDGLSSARCWVRSAAPTAHSTQGKEYSVVDEATSQPYKGLEVSNEAQLRIALLDNEVYQVRDLFRRYYTHKKQQQEGLTNSATAENSEDLVSSTSSSDVRVVDNVDDAPIEVAVPEVAAQEMAADLMPDLFEGETPPIVDIVLALRYTKTSFLVYEVYGNRDFSGWNSSMRLCPWSLIRDALGFSFTKAIAFLEREYKAHRYLAPNALLVSTNGTVKLTNFKYCIDVPPASYVADQEPEMGGSRLSSSTGPKSIEPHLPSPHQIPAADKLFLAPELLDGMRGDCKSDVFSIPMILLFILLGDLFEAVVPQLLETQAKRQADRKRKVKGAGQSVTSPTDISCPLLDPSDLAEALVWVTDVRMRSGISAASTTGLMPFANLEALAILATVQRNQSSIAKGARKCLRIPSAEELSKTNTKVLTSRLPEGSHRPPMPPSEMLPSTGDSWQRSKDWALSSLASRTMTPCADGRHINSAPPPPLASGSNAPNAGSPNYDSTSSAQFHTYHYLLPDGETPLEPSLCPFVPHYEVLADLCALLSVCTHKDPAFRPTAAEVARMWASFVNNSLQCQ